MNGESNILEAALLRTMTLLASLNVASEITFGMRERKAGRDPSSEETEDVVLPVLREEITTLKAIVFQLQSSLALAEDTHAPHLSETPQAEPVQRFIDLVRVQKAGQILHGIHQRLLSLYPAIDEAVAEEARLLKSTCDTLKDVEPVLFMASLAPFVNRAQHFARLIDQSI